MIQYINTIILNNNTLIGTDIIHYFYPTSSQPHTHIYTPPTTFYYICMHTSLKPPKNPVLPMTQLAVDLKRHDSKIEWTKSSSFVCETWGIPTTGNLVGGFLSSPMSWEIIFKSNWPISPRGICPWLFGLISSLLLVEAAILDGMITLTDFVVNSLGCEALWPFTLR